jgi:hypothetical protein
MSVSPIGHTDEARELVARGEITPGSKALDVPPSSMSDREIAEETLIHLRNQRDVVNGLITELMASPLGKMMGANGNPFAAFGR